MNGKRKWPYLLGVCISVLYLLIVIVNLWFADIILTNRVGPVGNGPTLTTFELVLFCIHLVCGTTILIACLAGLAKKNG